MHANSTNSTNATLAAAGPARAYDGTGAALFIVSVVLVYGLGVVVILLLALTRRARKFGNYDEQVSVYEQGRAETERQARLDSIFLAEYTLRNSILAAGRDNGPAGHRPADRRFSIPSPPSQRPKLRPRPDQRPDPALSKRLMTTDL